MNTTKIYDSEATRKSYTTTIDGADVASIDIESSNFSNTVTITLTDGRKISVETTTNYDDELSTEIYEVTPSTEPKAEPVRTTCGLMAPDALMNCTLAPLHDGDHEAHGPAPEHRLCHSWHA